MVHLIFKELAKNNSIFVSGIESNCCWIHIIIHFILVSSLLAASVRGSTPQQDAAVYLSCGLAGVTSPSNRRKSCCAAELSESSKATHRAKSSSRTRNQESQVPHRKHNPLRPQLPDSQCPLSRTGRRKVKKQSLVLVLAGLAGAALGSWEGVGRTSVLTGAGGTVPSLGDSSFPDSHHCLCRLSLCMNPAAGETQGHHQIWVPL